MKLIKNPLLLATPGDFSAHVDEAELHVPEEIARIAQALYLPTAQALAGYVEAFPSSIALTLGWTVHDVVAAGQRLQALLSLEITPVQRPAYGFEVSNASRQAD